MDIFKLNRKPEPHDTRKLVKAITMYQKLLDELDQHKLPDDMIEMINSETEAIESSNRIENHLASDIRRVLRRIVRTLVKRFKLVPKNYYRNIWTGIGMSAFGIPIGVSYGLAVDNMAFIGIGIGMGLAIGMAIGAGMDRKALKEGRQLNIDYEM